jgi:hypothetical protein
MTTKKTKRTTDTLYVRIPKETIAKLRARVAELGWPHTMASVTADVIERGLLPPKPDQGESRASKETQAR